MEEENEDDKNVSGAHHHSPPSVAYNVNAMIRSYIRRRPVPQLQVNSLFHVHVVPPHQSLCLQIWDRASSLFFSPLGDLSEK